MSNCKTTRDHCPSDHTWQVDYDLPLPVGVYGSFRPPVINVRRADKATLLVVILGVRVTTEKAEEFLNEIHYQVWLGIMN